MGGKMGTTVVKQFKKKKEKKKKFWSGYWSGPGKEILDSLYIIKEERDDHPSWMI